MEKINLSIVMPALNEEKNIESAMHNALNALTDYEIVGELICINDGSSDRTQKIMKDVQRDDSRVRIISHDKPNGFGASFWEGVMESKMETVVVLPGDNENDPWEILRYFHLLQHVDIVIPFVYNKEARSMFRRLISFLYRAIINITFHTNLNYTNGTILYRASVLRKLTYQSSSFFFQTDILIRLIKNGYLFAEVPYRLEQRENGISTAVSFPSFFHVMCGYVRLVRDHYRQTDQHPHLDETVTALRQSSDNMKFKG